MPRSAAPPMRQPLPPASEEAFLQQLRSLARYTGWRTYHTRNSTASDAGFPDVVLVKPPRLVFVELKMPGRNRTAAQAEWGDDLLASGIEYHCWWPQDFPAIAAFFGVELA